MSNADTLYEIEVIVVGNGIEKMEMQRRSGTI